MSSPKEVGGRDLHCDNFALCGGVFAERGTMVAGLEQARVKGWHIFHGYTVGGAYMVSFLCPACVGQRARLPKPPPHLLGQEELF